jgi:hypothetical protein
MARRTIFTTVTALPSGISRESVMGTLSDHFEMIDLNPLVEERHPIKPPNYASAEKYHCKWYQLTDMIRFLPGGLYSHKITYNVCFHDLSNGLQTHVYAPMGLNIKGKWTLGGWLPGELREAIELGFDIPMSGLWLREDVDMKCNIFMTNFVKRTLKKAHARLVERLLVKAQLLGVDAYNANLKMHRPSLASKRPESPEIRAAVGLRNSPSITGTASSQKFEISPTDLGPRFSYIDIRRRSLDSVDYYSPTKLSSSSAVLYDQILESFSKPLTDHAVELEA